MGTMLEKVGSLELATRLRTIRVECFGEAGVPDLADRIGIPPQTWDNYEYGVTIPGSVLLGFLAITCTEPMWLMTGDGPRYRSLPLETSRSGWR
ncbi:hypothetical protein TA3x_000580 [Tundrisphaera sp. TA3]|uniref:hypothetical protein n=1 Tax=Tundrisphaera sp. TA3 TaxID=3435775 RepID=UPI003EBEEBE5